MNRLLVILLVLSIYFNAYSLPLYHKYQLQNIQALQNAIGFGQKASIKDLPTVNYGIKGESQAEIYKQRELISENQLIDGSSEEALIFFRISSLMTGIYSNASEFTREDVDTITRWWRENENLVSKDFMRDLLWYTKILNSWDYLSMTDPLPEQKLRSRLKERIIYRKTKSKYCDGDYIIPSEDQYYNSPKDEISSLQNEIQNIFNNQDDYGSSVESIIPRGHLRFYFYILKRLMNNEQWDLFTPITRTEFENMMDWWFVNNCLFEEEAIKRLQNEYLRTISNL